MKTAIFQVLSSQEIATIQNASLSILEETGIVVDHPDLVALLYDHGATVDATSHAVRLSSALVERALATVPPRVTLFNRAHEPSVVLGDGRTNCACGHAAINFLDYQTGRRPARKQDVANLFRIADALDTFTVVAPPAVPQDVIAESCFLHAIDAGLNHSRKHLFAAIDTPATAKTALEMARVLAGTDNLADCPVMTVQQSIQSPLTWPAELAGVVLEAVRAGAPIVFHTAPLIGVSGPITLAGLLALYNAEILSAIVISQLIRQGAPVIYGGGWGTFDLRGANRVLGAPEASLQVIAGTQLARAYNIPCHAIGPDTDAHGPDEQTGWEKMLKAVCAIQSGVSLFVNAGMFDTGMTASYEQLILDNEMLELAFRFSEGIAVNAETLALDVIRHVGPGGDYLSEDHTLRNLRSGEFWDPTVSNRNSYPQWEEMGCPSVLERAHERAEEILNSHEIPELDPAKRGELTRLIQAFEREYGSAEGDR